MLRGILLHNGIVERFQCCVGGCLGHPPSGCPHSPPLHTTMFPCIALVMPFSRNTLTELNMTLVRLSGAKSLRDLHLLSTNKGGVPNLHGLGISGPRQRG